MAARSRTALIDVVGCLVVTIVTALVVGRLVAVLGWLIRWPTQADMWWSVLTAAGAVMAILVIHRAGVLAATADAYVVGLHVGRTDVAAAPARLVALLLGVGLGVPLGYEGLMVYFGGAVGALAADVLDRPRERSWVLAAAAAGVAMVIESPLAAALFVSEVARRGLPRWRDLLPLASGALASWAVLRLADGSGGVLGIDPVVSTRSLAPAAVVVGLACGVLGRGFVALIRTAKALDISLSRRLVIAPTVLCGALLGGWWLAGDGIFLGSGARLLGWAPGSSPLAVLAATSVFVVLVVVMVASGVVGGLFLPLVSLGGLVGHLLTRTWLSGVPTAVVVGVGGCAMLAAGYATPLAAGALALGLFGWSSATGVTIAAIVVARLAAGRQSVSLFQI